MISIKKICDHFHFLPATVIISETTIISFTSNTIFSFFFLLSELEQVQASHVYLKVCRYNLCLSLRYNKIFHFSTLVFWYVWCFWIVIWSFNAYFQKLAITLFDVSHNVIGSCNAVSPKYVDNESIVRIILLMKKCFPVSLIFFINTKFVWFVKYMMTWNFWTQMVAWKNHC